MRVLRAFPTLLRVGLAGAVAYRAEMVVWMLSMTMPLVSLALWSAVAQTAPVGRYAQRDFLSYFLAVVVVRQLTGAWVVWELIQEIKSGAVASRLLKPMHPFVAYAADNIAALPMRALLVLPVAIGMFASAGAPHVDLNSPSAVLVLILSMAGAWLISFFAMAIIGTLSFFIESSSSIFDAWLAIFMLLSGYLVPLDLFPGWVQKAANALPMRYMLAFPVSALTGSVSLADAWGDLLVQWAYAIGAGIAAGACWRAGVRRYSSFGG